jgi:hypothetical protein
MDVSVSIFNVIKFILRLMNYHIIIVNQISEENCYDVYNHLEVTIGSQYLMRLFVDSLDPILLNISHSCNPNSKLELRKRGEEVLMLNKRIYEVLMRKFILIVNKIFR